MSSFFDGIRQLGFRRGPSRLVGGVCAGLAQQFGLNVTIVRLVTLVLFLLPVLSVAVYLLAWALLPWQDGSIPLERFLASNSSTTPRAGDGVTHVPQAQDRPER